jgi:hypothetical protein
MFNALILSLAIFGQCPSGTCAVPGYAPAVRYRPVPKYRLRRYPAPAYRAPAPRVPYYVPTPAARIELYPDRPTTVVVPWPAGVPR